MTIAADQIRALKNNYPCDTGIHMKTKILLFARIRDLAGTDCVELDVPDPARIAELKEALAKKCPNVSPILANLLFAVGTDYANDCVPLRPDTDIACFLPVSGG